MHISFLIISCLIALFFMFYSNRITTNWIKKTFSIYSLLFTIVAFAIGLIFLFQNKTMIKSAFNPIKQPNNIVTVAAPEPLISQYNFQGEIKLKAPLIKQLPELPRGCEVTSLAMLLQYHDIDVDKMELAKKITRDTTPYKKTGKEIYFGNPHRGFVGDMYSFENPGLGVYHEPLAELAETYVGDRVYDFSGGHFSEIFDQLNKKRPVVVIINATYKELDENHFTTWQTPDGPIDITMKEHSVLITGYDHDYIYFNDPLNRDKKAPIDEFKAAWVQMGKQAITVR